MAPDRTTSKLGSRPAHLAPLLLPESDLETLAQTSSQEVPATLQHGDPGLEDVLKLFPHRHARGLPGLNFVDPKSFGSRHNCFPPHVDCQIHTRLRLNQLEHLADLLLPRKILELVRKCGCLGESLGILADATTMSTVRGCRFSTF